MKVMTTRPRSAALIAATVVGSLLAIAAPSAVAQTSTFSGTLDSAGTSWRTHAVPVPQAGTITATLDWTNAAVDMNLFLRNPSGTQVAAATTGNRPEAITYQATTTGTYSFGVKAKSGGLTNYTLTVEHPDDPTTPPPPGGDEDWPMLGHDIRHTGVSGETTLDQTNAASLGIRWQANTGTASYTSSAVAWVPAAGKRLVFAGNQSGTLAAYDAGTGSRLWFYKVPASIQSSPTYDDGTVYFGASDEYVYALNASTGALRCRFFTDGIVSSSPLVVDPNGTGKVIYIGDNGITGADDGGNLWAINAVDPNAAANCSLRWRFDGYGATPGSQPNAGTWSPPAFGVDATGRPLIVFGGSSPDNAVYAVNAVTGARVWRFQTEVFHQDNDVGAGATISPPNMNGFADGVAYVSGKNRIVYALNLRTGAKIWEFRIRDQAWGAGGATRSTAALTGNRLIVGYGSGVLALNATTGAEIWHSQTAGFSTAEVISSPALTGTAATRILFVGDLAGKVYAIRVSDGAKLWEFPTGGFIYGSVAPSGGRAFVTSSDGYLYAFGLGGSVSEPPNTLFSNPANNATLPNPGGNLRLSGSATDDAHVERVLVAIKNKNTNAWWNGTTGTWKNIYHENVATLSNPGGTSTNWNYDVPMPPTGGVFFAQAEAVDDDGQHDPTVAQVNFTVSSSGSPPETTITSPVFKQVFHFPGGTRQSFPITVQGTATDAGGANRGIASVKVVIKNIEHGEFYCGSAGCSTGGGESSSWRPVFTILNASLASPGANSTTWTITFPTYDHPHKYRITAWAVDRDGEEDATRAIVSRICVRDVGDNSCV
jgi:outer membrane protein assembly factor BamB